MLETLVDIFYATKNDLVERIGSDNIRAIVLYGSFSYRDLNREVSSFDVLNGSEGLLDKKPDYVVIVDDVKSALVGASSKSSNIVDDVLQKTSKFSESTPYYFNSQTLDSFEFQLSDSLDFSQIPYKVGIVSSDNFPVLSDSDLGIVSPSFNKNLIYMCMRLSKPVNVFTPDGILDSNVILNNFRDFMVDVALNYVDSERFTIEDFTSEYVNTYRFEKYRIFDILRNKHLSILNSSFFDISQLKLVPMTEALSDIVLGRLYSNPSVDLRFESNEQIFSIDNAYKKYFINVPKGYTGSCINASRKNGIVNSALGSQSNMDYLLRKFGFSK